MLAPHATFSEAKRAILRRAPEGWFMVAAVGEGHNKSSGFHLQQMFQVGLVERRGEVSADVE